MNTSQLKNFAIQSRNLLKTGVLNRIIALGFDVDGNLTVDRPVKIQGGTIFMGQLREEGFYDAWTAVEERIARHGIKEVCEEAAYTWFNRLVAIRIMQKNGFIEPVMQYASEVTRIPVIVDQARSGRLALQMTAAEKEKLDDLLRDPTKTNEQFNLLISAFCTANPVIFKCFGGIEKHIALLLPDNILAQGGFIDMLNNTPYLTDEDYKQSELIGWLYQFYISERKDEVFAKKGKYTPEEIPAATQIFTPNWIVKYMVQNTLGRIYLDNTPYSDLGDQMKYLVKMEKTPEEAILKIDEMEGYTLIDPACGSGHILVEAFDLLYTMYQEEGYPTKASITNILTKNIIGIDLDTRAKQLATFALLMKACQKDRSFLDCNVMPRVLDMPEPFVYRGGTMKEFLAQYFLGGNDKIISETEKALELMQDANSLGSIMKFEISDETRAAIKKSTEEWEKHEFVNPDIEKVIPSMRVILALTDKYATTVMNPPYMGSGSFDSVLSLYIANNYREGKSDLFAVFMQVGLNILLLKGKMGMINMQSWMFLTSFEKLRETILEHQTIDSFLHLGPHTFDELGGEVVQNAAFVLCNKKYSGGAAPYYSLVKGKNCEDKRVLFLDREGLFNNVYQNNFNRIPGTPIGYTVSEKVYKSFEFPRVKSYGFAGIGMRTGDNLRFLRFWSEVDCKKFDCTCQSSTEALSKQVKWIPYNKGGSFRRWYGNNDYVVNWYNDGEEIKENTRRVYPYLGDDLSWKISNESYYFKPGITWSGVGAKKMACRQYPAGYIFDSGANGLFVREPYSLEYFTALLNTDLIDRYIKLLNPTINTGAGTINSLPVKYDNNLQGQITEKARTCIYISKLDWDAHETSWDFKKNELIDLYNETHWDKSNTRESRLERVLELLKDHWTILFNQLHSNEEELNRQFIDIYGLQDELTPDVPLNEITILQQGEISIENDKIVWHDDVVIKQLISYAIGCWMGRYRLDQEGLYIAHRPTPEEVCTYTYDGQQFEIDDDAIVPLMGRDNPFEDDNALQKVVNFVRIAFGEDNLTDNLNFIEHCLGKSIEDYLIKDYWKDHKKMYQNRPIYWLFSSKKGAFQVLVYMHRMNPYTVEKIRTKYLLPYIEYLKGKIEVDEARGVSLSTAERRNLAKMKAAFEECTQYHDRLHDVAIKNIDFDLDDGVVVNYAKFGDILAKIK